MKFNIKWALLFMLAVVILGKYTYDQFAQPFPTGDTAPDFSLADLDGNSVRLSDLKGQPLLVHFWATWCPQCIHELPLLDNFSRRHPEIKVIAVNEDEGDADVIAQFFGDTRPGYVVLLDPEGRVADRYKNYKVPETYLLDSNGRFLHRFIGAVSWNEPAAIEKIEQLLSKTSNNY